MPCLSRMMFQKKGTHSMFFTLSTLVIAVGLIALFAFAIVDISSSIREMSESPATAKPSVLIDLTIFLIKNRMLIMQIALVIFGLCLILYFLIKIWKRPISNEVMRKDVG